MEFGPWPVHINQPSIRFSWVNKDFIRLVTNSNYMRPPVRLLRNLNLLTIDDINTLCSSVYVTTRGGKMGEWVNMKMNGNLLLASTGYFPAGRRGSWGLDAGRLHHQLAAATGGEPINRQLRCSGPVWKRSEPNSTEGEGRGGEAAVTK